MTRQRSTFNPETGPFPIATVALIGAQVVAWLIVRRFLLAGDAWTDFAILPGAPREFGLLISPFVHLEPAHLGVNLAVLWLFGTHLERVVGPLKFLALYLSAAWFAALMQWAVFTSFHLFPEVASRNAAVGSSGAVAGVLGASLVRFPQQRLRAPLFPKLQFPATPVIVLWVLYTVARALLSTVAGVPEGVGHWAHFAGFVFGLGAAQLSGMTEAARVEYLRNAAAEAAARNDLLGAAQAWSALLQVRPDDLEVRTGLVSARLALGDLPGGRRLAREGIEKPARAGERQAAVDAYLSLVDLVPDVDLPPGIRYRIGCWLADAGEGEPAFRALWDSVREDGATASAAGALYRAGQVAWERMRSRRRAEQAWERLLEQFPDSPWTDAARDGLRQLSAAG